MLTIKRNERDWAGQLISWLKQAIDNGLTVFQDATNDTGIKTTGKQTKFPDILLFSDKVSGIVFNGWELKFPDTAVDDRSMLENALEKARRLHSESFVTWNGAEAIIWGVDTGSYSLDTLSIIKHYPRESAIAGRDDLADASRYARNEQLLKTRALEILHDLGQLLVSGRLKPAINVCGTITDAIRVANQIIVPQLTEAIKERCGRDKNFRNEYNQWKIYESSTLKILESSSRRKEAVNPYEVLAKFTFYNVIGKCLFYLTLSENLGGVLPRLEIKTNHTKEVLNQYFDRAKAIDYQAIFRPYFTDDIAFSVVADTALRELLHTLTDFDFKRLPSGVIGNILENIVPADEKQKFGQYFTSPELADLVSFPAVPDRDSVLLDPTSGTGTFLCSFYGILSHWGCSGHQKRLSQIWGNDISHFPAILSVINLYKQDVSQTDNFPRVMRDDFFNLSPGDLVSFPNPQDYSIAETEEIPMFDGIASNFPFIQQEDIPNEELAEFFARQFGTTQPAFMHNGQFKINERSDYFTYCIYNSFRFLKQGGIISAVTSNAWLGKEYGSQFKRFLLDNFHIKYVVRSNAEHWFKESQVATVFVVFEKGVSDEPTRFVSFNFKLADFFSGKSDRIGLIENLYSEIDNCCDTRNTNWQDDLSLKGVRHSRDGLLTVSTVEKNRLLNSLDNDVNWSQFFISPELFDAFDDKLVIWHNRVVNVVRGERTGWNPMFVIPNDKLRDTGIPKDFLCPYVKSPSEFETIGFSGKYRYWAFVCDKAMDDLDDSTRKWIERFKDAPNKNHTATISEACSGHKPYWYSISPKKAHIVTAINPYERFFFTFSETPFVIDQRMITLQVNSEYDVELVAALLNSAVTFLTLEMRGTSRSLGALDLNANFMKSVRLLNPDLLDEASKERIVSAFRRLKNVPVMPVDREVTRPERRLLDQAVLAAYGYDPSLLDTIYRILVDAVNERVSMKDR